MKKYLLLTVMLMFIGISAFAQAQKNYHIMNIHGWVFDASNGSLASHHWVYFRSYNSNAYPEKDSALTNSYGHYHLDSIICQDYTILNIEVFSYDCNLVKHSYHIFSYDPYKTLNFTLCIGPLTFCQSQWTWSPDILNNLKLQFTDESLGDINYWRWDFGDGTISLLTDPVHEYSSAGTYQVIHEVRDTTYFPPCISADTQYITITQTSYYNLGGQVFAGPFPHNSAQAVLYFKTQKGFALLDSSALNSNGVFYFYQVPQGNYLVQIRTTNTPNLPGPYWPTYNGDNITWAVSPLIDLSSDYFQTDVHLKPLATPPTGPGIIRGTTFDNTTGSPLPGNQVEVILTDENNNPLDFSVSNQQGEYVFNSLPFGTYHLFVESPGFNIPGITVILDADQPEYYDADFLLQNNPIGMEENLVSTDAVSVYPNPSRGSVNLEMNLEQCGNVTCSVMNLLGQVLLKESLWVSPGSNIAVLPLENLSSGTYFVTVQQENKAIIRKKFILTR